MIELRGISKSYRTRQGRRYIFKDLSLRLPTGANIGLLGRNGAGKSTLMRILGGIDHPDEGEVVTSQSISWPLALTGGFQGSLSGRDNVKFVCRVYGREADIDEKLAWVKEFSGIGDYFEEPVKTYSSGMRSRLAFAMSMAFRFDVYLIDEITAVGDQSFKEHSRKAFSDMRERASIIMVSHDLNAIRQQCDQAVLLDRGTATLYEDVDEALACYRALQ